MSEIASQADVDAVAHFVQAARDLRASPLFVEELRELGITYNDFRDGQTVPVTYRLPDPRVRDALVIPFRRIWMSGEPANFERVGNILKRHVPQWRQTIDAFKHSCHEDRKEFHSPTFLGLTDKPLGISPEDTIDLWLNCRLAHVGATATKGALTRADYERESARLGEAKFEYLFLMACFHVGLWYLNLLQFAEDILAGKWAAEGLKPSFIFEDNLALAGAGSCKDGVRIERSTPGMTVLADDLPAQLKLLRRRRAFSGIDELLEMLSDDIGPCVHLLRAASDLNGLCILAGFETEAVNAVSDMEGASHFCTIGDDCADLRLYPWRKGMVGRFDRTIKMQGQAHGILEDQFFRLRAELFRAASSPSL